jgi:predicted transcriptional regulator
MFKAAKSLPNVEVIIKELLKEDIPEDYRASLRQTLELTEQYARTYHDEIHNADVRFEVHQTNPSKAWYYRGISNGTDNPIGPVIQKLSPEAGWLMLLLEVYSKTQYITISLPEIGALTGWTKKTASKHLKELVDEGMLIKVKDRAGTSPAVYRWNYCYVQIGKGYTMQTDWDKSKTALKKKLEMDGLDQLFRSKTKNVTLDDGHSASVSYLEHLSKK